MSVILLLVLLQALHDVPARLVAHVAGAVAAVQDSLLPRLHLLHRLEVNLELPYDRRPLRPDVELQVPVPGRQLLRFVAIAEPVPG